jgi:hypothetical protein
MREGGVTGGDIALHVNAALESSESNSVTLKKVPVCTSKTLEHSTTT